MTTVSSEEPALILMDHIMLRLSTYAAGRHTSIAISCYQMHKRLDNSCERGALALMRSWAADEKHSRLQNSFAYGGQW